jgi:predicted ATPase/DNA-binding SARP family transcriptional activator/Tfp pilus assembly protein PilF
MDRSWRIELFGDLRAFLSDRALTRFATQKAAGLLAFLAYHPGRRHPRDQLIALFWPDTDVAKARHSLSQALTFLRRDLGGSDISGNALLLTDRTTVRLNADVVATDVAEFREAIAAAGRATELSERRGLLTRAVELYRAPLLDGFCDDWVLQERGALAELYFDALRQLLGVLEGEGRFETAIGYARRGVGLDPLREETHRDLMRVLAASGQPEAALRQYREVERRLCEELETRPSAATRALASRIRRIAEETLPSRPALPRARQRAATRRRPNPAPQRSASDLIQSPSLPVPLTQFFGRQDEMSRLRVLLSDRNHANTRAHLVTLTGPGGSGKTRLAIEIAAGLRDTFTDGVCFVSLAPIRNPELVLPMIARTLGVRENAGRPLLQILKERLRDRRLLLLLDNFEHVVSAAPEIADLLASCPRLGVLVTSRMRLNLRGEHSIPVPPLEAPHSDCFEGKATNRLNARRLEALASSQYPAVALFLERAREVNPSFVLTDENAPAVAMICRRLDGLPLALELAAAHLRVLPLQALLERLTGRDTSARNGGRRSSGSTLQMLTGGARDLPARQQTLQDTIAWSYDLLAEQEKTLFHRLAVFAGSWSIETAEAICAESEPIFDALLALADRSLVMRQEGEGQTRYRMLETIREFALDRLAQSGEEATIRDRHARFFTSLAEEAEAAQCSSEWVDEWPDRLERDLDNIRGALAWLGERGDAEAELRLALALGRFWGEAGRCSEGRDCFLRALARPGAAPPTAARSWALYAAGTLSLTLGDYTPARRLFEEALIVSRAAGEKPALAVTFNNYGLLARDGGDYATARRLFEEALAVNRETGDRKSQAPNLCNLAHTLLGEGDYAQAKRLYEEADAIDREFGGWGDAFWGPGVVALKQGDDATARRILEEALERARAVRHQPTMAEVLRHLAQLACRQGEYAQAQAYLEEGLTLSQSLEHLRAIVYSLQAFAALAVAQSEPERAARLFGAADAILASMGTALSPTDRAEHDNHVSTTRAQLDEAAFAAAWEEGNALTTEEAIELAFAETEESSQTS